MGTYEVIAYKGKNRIVKYYTVLLKEGISNTIFDLCKRLGYHDITMRLMA